MGARAPSSQARKTEWQENKFLDRNFFLQNKAKT
jgi:hypothetical protein